MKSTEEEEKEINKNHKITNQKKKKKKEESKNSSERLHKSKSISEKSHKNNKLKNDKIYKKIYNQSKYSYFKWILICFPLIISFFCVIFFPLYFKNKNCKKCVNIINCNISSVNSENNTIEFRNSDLINNNPEDKDTFHINNSEKINDSNNNNDSYEDEKTIDIKNNPIEDKSSININKKPLEDKNSNEISNNSIEDKNVIDTEKIVTEGKNLIDINSNYIEDKSSIDYNNNLTEDISESNFNNNYTQDNNSVNINNNFTKEEEKSKDIIEEEYDTFKIDVLDLRSLTLTPINGYDSIYIHLGGIMEVIGTFTSFFKSKSTFIPKGTKIYYFAGKISKINYVENFPFAPNWFNVDKNGNLICDNCNDQYKEAKESLYYIQNKIEEIHVKENIAYDKIYLGGFSQGAIMTNYVLLNFNYKLAGYLAFSGYIFHHSFPPNYVQTNLTFTQKVILLARKDYHILATHSFNDNSVPYSRAIEAYYTYFRNFTDFKLLSFGQIGHEFITQPTHPFVKKWLKESMGK